jgi:hypothetical protein
LGRPVGDAFGMRTNTAYAPVTEVDREELDRQIATPTARQAELWAACIAGASQIDRYLENIGATDLQVRAVQTNPAYRFASERAQRTSRKYAAHSVSLLALKPASGSRPTNPTTTEEISK